MSALGGCTNIFTLSRRSFRVMECVYESSSYSRISYVKTPNVTYCCVDLRSCMCHDVLVLEVNIFIRNCKSRDSRPRPRLTSRDRDRDYPVETETETYMTRLIISRPRPRLVQRDRDSKSLVSSWSRETLRMAKHREMLVYPLKKKWKELWKRLSTVYSIN